MDKEVKTSFDSMFDLNKDGWLDAVEQGLQLSYIDRMARVPKYEIVDTTGFPFKLTNQRLSATGDTVIPVELDNNVEELHRFLFGNEN